MAVLGELQYALISNPGTQIGPLIPHVTVEERYHDETLTTDHPVEKGAAITDHAFERPALFEVRCGWSNSTAQQANYVAQVYAQMLSVKAQSRQKPLDVFTPRRMYKNMVITAVDVTRDAHSNNIIACSMGLKEIIIVSSQTTGGDAATQADPATSASPSDSGPISTTPGKGYDFTNMNAGNMGDSAAYSAQAPGTDFTGTGGQAFGSGYNVGALPGSSAAGYAASSPFEAGGLGGFNEISFTTPDGVTNTIPGPGMTPGPAVNGGLTPFTIIGGA